MRTRTTIEHDGETYHRVTDTAGRTRYYIDRVERARGEWSPVLRKMIGRGKPVTVRRPIKAADVPAAVKEA